jgi:hypothetical protein
MRLTRTAPQPAAPDEPPTGVWPAGPRDGYTGSFEASAFEQDGFGGGGNGGRGGDGFGDGRFDTKGFDPITGDEVDEDEYDRAGGGRHGHRGSRHRYDDDDGDDDYGHPGRRRWPIVTGALVLLVLLLGGGVYGAWWYNQQQYYVGVQSGYVAVFQGTNQSVAGINLSKLLTRSTLMVSKLGLTDQDTLAQTISKGSVGDAKSLIDVLQSESTRCQGMWTALTSWQAKSVTYQNDLVRAEHSKPKIKVPASAAPGPMPARPDLDSCAPAAAFGIPASALPSTQTTAPAPPATTPTAKPSVTVKPSVTARPRGTATKSPAAG